ncbi:hypothetical protein L798_14273 [Zootermopsis nevadensis]|uniref:Uncharacterized protein n=1 Tax=Zootermopsis nevadensis TaxID=136037 RepID=A0A067QZC5_ZOONE|nr:hypothetical protein L798_14273 [Zootermopsis nevadensis]
MASSSGSKGRGRREDSIEASIRELDTCIPCPCMTPSIKLAYYVTEEHGCTWRCTRHRPVGFMSFIILLNQLCMYTRKHNCEMRCTEFSTEACRLSQRQQKRMKNSVHCTCKIINFKSLDYQVNVILCT